jgi:hypothetical protein
MNGLRQIHVWLAVVWIVAAQMSGCSTGDGTRFGRKVTVGPYHGDVGDFEVGSGGRDVTRLGAAGLLVSKDGRRFSTSNSTNFDRMARPRQMRLPVGDYAAVYLRVNFGSLVVDLSSNSYDTSRPQSRRRRPPTHAIQIRKDKPFVMDFSHEPQVLFLSPVMNRTYRPGQKIQLTAVLLDPGLDLMVRDLEDTGRQVGGRTVRNELGKRVTVPRYASLDPTVSIRDSSGREIVKGKMPFG